VQNNILDGRQCISLETLQTVYGIGVGSRQSRHKLKERLLKTFGDQLVFLSQESHSPVVVISKECLQTQTLSNTLQFSNKSVVKKSAFALRDVALKFIDDVADNPWPPTVESLNERASKIPELIKFFYIHLAVIKERATSRSFRESQQIGRFVQSRHIIGNI
jgi:hypothetical protein